jgi:hypothetical protein
MASLEKMLHESGRLCGLSQDSEVAIDLPHNSNAIRLVGVVDEPRKIALTRCINDICVIELKQESMVPFIVNMPATISLLLSDDLSNVFADQTIRIQVLLKVSMSFFSAREPW